MGNTVARWTYLVGGLLPLSGVVRLSHRLPPLLPHLPGDSFEILTPKHWHSNIWKSPHQRFFILSRFLGWDMNQIRTFNGETVQVDKYFDQGTFDRNEYIRPCQCCFNKYLQIDNFEVSRQKVQCRPKPGIHREMLHSHHLLRLHLRSPSICRTKFGLLLMSET